MLFPAAGNEIHEVSFEGLASFLSRWLVVNLVGYLALLVGSVFNPAY